ncbi:mitochondrial uncoupling protein 3-like [Bidens hawaiensis]|uniref:mitochondrial uncoupling protein 3-like n=1 Tax=Bidens hawaiensis TaxID=980011 RepID=UPI00404A5E79
MAHDQPEPQPTTINKIGLASLSAMVAETTTFPIDIIKTRLQLHSTNRPVSAFHVASDIIRKQGVTGLFIRHLFYTPIRTVGYEQLRHVFIQSDNGSIDLPIKALIGGVSGVIAQVVASPADLVKVRMQADGRMVSQGLRPRYTGSIDALTKIINTDVFKGLWRGVIPNIQRAFLVNMGELACYDHAKHFVINSSIANDNIYAHTLASMMSGLTATTISCPADVVKTRMMNQVGNGYTSSYDCLVKTIRFEGFRALWKGFFPTWARLGPWQFVFWVSYEKFRLIVGLPSF